MKHELLIAPDIDPKEQLRAEFMRGDRPTDHGTRGDPGKDKELEYLNAPKEPIEDFDFGSFDDEANAWSDGDDPVALNHYRQGYGMDEENWTAYDPDARPYHGTGWDGETSIEGSFWDLDEETIDELGYDTDYKKVFVGSIAMYTALRNDTDYMYEGQTDQDHGDYEAVGFHVVSRP